MGDSTIDLYRCSVCRSLLTQFHFRHTGLCPRCGSRRLNGGSPINIFEEILIRWWQVKYTVKEIIKDA